MIPVVDLLYDLDFKLNKLASNQHQYIPVEDKIVAINEAQLRVIKNKLNNNNIYHLGFDAFKTRYQELQEFVIDYEEINVEQKIKALNSYSFKLENLDYKFYLPVDIICNCTKNSCQNHQVDVTRIVKHGDLRKLLKNSNYAPSFEYQETLAVISSGETIMYTDGSFTIDSALVSYLRYPNVVDIEGYQHLDGTDSITVDCELPLSLRDELLEKAIIELGFDTGNINAAKAAQEKLKESE